MKALQVQDLDQMDCGNPHCQFEHPIYIQPKCHVSSGVDVVFDKDTSTLMVQCHECREQICKIAVAAATTH